MAIIPSGQSSLGEEWVTGLTQIPRGEYRDKDWNGITWPLVWCEDEQRWYVARSRLATETLGIARQGLERRLSDDPIVSKGCNNLLLPSSGGMQPTACFLFDDLPYVLQGIEPHAPGLRPEVRPHLITLKGLSRDILRDVLIYGKTPDILKERQQVTGIDNAGALEARLQLLEDRLTRKMEQSSSDVLLEIGGLRGTLSEFDTLIKHAFWKLVIYVIDLPLDYARKAEQAEWFLSHGYLPVKVGKANDMPARLQAYTQDFGETPIVRRIMMTDNQKAEGLLKSEGRRPRGVVLMKYPFDNRERFWALPEHLTGLDTWPEGMSYADLQLRFSGWRLQDHVLVPSKMKIAAENRHSRE